MLGVKIVPVPFVQNSSLRTGLRTNLESLQHESNSFNATSLLALFDDDAV